MLKLSGNTKLQVRFVAWLTVFFIVIVLVFHVGLVEAASSDTTDGEQLRVSGPHIYDSVPDGYSTFSDSGFNMDFTNDIFSDSLNITDLTSVDSSNPLIGYSETYYGWTFPLVYFDNNLSNGEFFLPNSFTYNGSTYSLSSLYDSCFISGSTATNYSCIFYNRSNFGGLIFANKGMYCTVNISRSDYEQGTDEFKLANFIVSIEH